MNINLITQRWYEEKGETMTYAIYAADFCHLFKRTPEELIVLIK